MPANPKKTTPNTRRMWSIREDSTWPTPTGTAPPPPPSAIEWLGSVQTELGERNGDGKPRAGHRLPAHSAAGILRLSEGSARMDAERRGTRARTPGVAMCSTMRSAAPARGSARRSAARTRMWARWMPCARLAAISRCSAGMTIRTLSLVMCMISIWAMHPRAGSNAMVPIAVPRHSPV